MKIKTSDLVGPALNWAVAKCAGETCHASASLVIMGAYSPSTDWAQGGPIIEQELIRLSNDGPGLHCAFYAGKSEFWAITPLIAAMRCYAASKLGDEIEVPDGLV